MPQDTIFLYFYYSLDINFVKLELTCFCGILEFLNPEQLLVLHVKKDMLN